MNIPRLAHVGAILLVAAAMCAAEEDHIVLIDSARYSSPGAAQAAWTAGEHATPPIEIGSIEAQPALKLSCNFATNDAWRVAWDLAGRWDLAACQTIRLDVSVPGDRAAELIVYLHSGEGWYSCHAGAAPGRSVVTLPRKKFQSEGKPGGWEAVDRLRLSILRDEARDRVVLLGRIEAVAALAAVAMYRNDAGAKAEPGFGQCARRMGDALDRLSIAYELVGDEEVAAGRLAGKKVVILPLNPVLPKPAARALETYVAAGGKLIVFYCLPDPLGALLGVKSAGSIGDADKLRGFTLGEGAHDPIAVIQDSWIAHRVTPTGAVAVAFWTAKDGKPTPEPAVTANTNGYFVGHILTDADQRHKDVLIQDMVGRLWPGMWERVYASRVASFGHVAGFGNFAEILAACKANAAGEESSRRALAAAAGVEGLRRDAEGRATGRDFKAAAQLLAAAQARLLEAYAATVPSKSGEFRGVWCHSHTGVADLTWDQAMQTLAEAGFNAILPNMCWGDSAAYPSAILARAAPADRDLLAECLAAAKKRGIAVHVWRVNWNLFWLADATRRAELRRSGRLQEDQRGEPIDWLCPSNPLNQKQELDAMVEIARNYDVAGLHFDYIRYPGGEGCYCPTCRARFEARVGARVKNWPADVTAGPLRQSYLQFRRDNITQLVAAVSEQARKVRPGLKISAAVFWQWPTARDQVGQDWKLWIEKGYVDFVCPMEYTTTAALFESQTYQTIGWAGGRVPVMPGIGATLGLAPDETLQQVLAARKQGAPGFVLFNYDRSLLEHLALLRSGATRHR